MHPIQETTRDLGYLIELVAKAMIGIFVIWYIAKVLLEMAVGPEASKIISAILGIAILFAVVVSKRVRDEIMDFGRGKR